LISCSIRLGPSRGRNPLTLAVRQKRKVQRLRRESDFVRGRSSLQRGIIRHFVEKNPKTKKKNGPQSLKDPTPKDRKSAEMTRSLTQGTRAAKVFWIVRCQRRPPLEKTKNPEVLEKRTIFPAATPLPNKKDPR